MICRALGAQEKQKQRCGGLTGRADVIQITVMHKSLRDYRKKQCWDWSAPFNVDHGQNTWKMTFSCTRKKQPRKRTKLLKLMQAWDCDMFKHKNDTLYVV